MTSSPDKKLIRGFQKYSTIDSEKDLFSSFQLEQKYQYKLSVIQNYDGPAYFRYLEISPNEQYPHSFSLEKSAEESNREEEFFDTLPTIILSTESKLDKFGKGIALISEIQTGNKLFDQKVFIDTTAPKEFVLSILSSPTIQEKILFLLENGWTTIALFHENSPIRVVYRIKKAPKNNTEQYLEAINTIAEQLPKIRVKNSKPAFLGTLNQKIASLILFFGIRIIGFSLFTDPPLTILDQSFFAFTNIIRLGIGASSFLILFVLLQGSSRSLKNLTLSFSLVCFVFIFPASMILERINSLFDTSPTQIAEGKIIKKRIRNHDEGPNTFHAKIASTDEEQNFQGEIEIDETQFKAMKKNQTLTLHYRAGFLGYAWLENYELDSPPPK